MGDILSAILDWNDAGPEAILVLMFLMVSWLARWLLKTLMADKESRIQREQYLTDKLTDEIGETLDAILNSIREQALKGKSQT
jgi:hypothetical protein